MDKLMMIRDVPLIQTEVGNNKETSWSVAPNDPVARTRYAGLAKYCEMVALSIL
jgi:hypothetical protein